jgi:hypothetical protein
VSARTQSSGDSIDETNTTDSLAATTTAKPAPSTTVPDWIVQAGRVVVTHTRAIDQEFFEEGGVSIVSITDSDGREVAAAKAPEPRYQEPVTLLAVSLPPSNDTATNFLRSCETECRLGLGRPDARCSKSFDVVRNVTATVDYTYFPGQSPMATPKRATRRLSRGSGPVRDVHFPERAG